MGLGGKKGSHNPKPYLNPKEPTFLGVPYYDFVI